MHTAERAQSLLCEVLNVPSPCDIGHNCQYVSPSLVEFMSGLGKRLFLDIRQDHAHPFLHATLSDATPNATRRAGDDGDLTFELLHDYLLCDIQPTFNLSISCHASLARS